MKFVHPFLYVMSVLLIACGDAGDPSAAAGSTSGGGPGICTPELHAKVLYRNGATLSEGTEGIVAISEELTVTCGKVEVDWRQYQLLEIGAKPKDTAPYCAAPCASPESWYFRKPRLVRVQDSAVIAQTDFGPKDDELALAAATFEEISGLIVEEGHPVVQSLVFDLADSLPAPAVKGQEYYVIPLGIGTKPSHALNEPPQDLPGDVFMKIGM